MLSGTMERTDSSDSALLALDAELMCGVDETTAAEGAAVSDLLEICADGPVVAKKKRGRPPKVKQETQGETRSLLEQASAPPISSAAAPADASAHITSAHGAVLGGSASREDDREGEGTEQGADDADQPAGKKRKKRSGVGIL